MKVLNIIFLIILAIGMWHVLLPDRYCWLSFWQCFMIIPIECLIAIRIEEIKDEIKETEKRNRK